MKNVTVLTLIGVLLTQGCASMLAHRSWEATNNTRAVVVRGDGQEVEVGVDLLSLEYLRKNWLVATGAALIDGITLYGVYNLYDKNFGSSGSSSSSSSSQSVDSGRDGTIINNYGDGNTFALPGDTTTSF